jgi:methionyl-tRNA formyltransferase
VRIVFLGTPADAVPALRALVGAGHDVALVVTQPDRRRGRGNASVPSPVKAAATELGLPVRTPERAGEVLDEVAASGAVVGVVVAFGQLLRQSLLDALPHGFVNVHFSLLPRWRGAAPVERAVLAGDAETGVCIMRIDAGLDTGPVFACEATPIGASETSGELRARLVEIGARLLVETLPRVPDTEPVEQHGEPVYAEKLTVEEFRLDPTRPAVELARTVRAGNPRPGAWTVVAGHRVKVLRAHAEAPDESADAPGDPRAPGQLGADGRLTTAAGLLAIDEVQPEGKRAMPADAWLRGLHGAPWSIEAQ